MKRVSWHLAEAMMNILELRLLEALKVSDYELSADQVPCNPVDEELMFRELDETGVACVLGSPITYPPPRSREVSRSAHTPWPSLLPATNWDFTMSTPHWASDRCHLRSTVAHSSTVSVLWHCRDSATISIRCHPPRSSVFVSVPHHSVTPPYCALPYLRSLSYFLLQEEEFRRSLR